MKKSINQCMHEKKRLKNGGDLSLSVIRSLFVTNLIMQSNKKKT